MAHHRAVRLVLQLLLVGVAGLSIVAVCVALLVRITNWSSLPVEIDAGSVLLVVGFAGLVAGFIWISRIAGDVGKV